MPENFNELDIVWYIDDTNTNIYGNRSHVDTSKNETDVIEVFTLVHKKYYTIHKCLDIWYMN